MSLPINVIEQDQALEKTAENTSAKLMELRWHWTLDESNPDRVPMREYARAVGRSNRVIQKYVHGWVIMQSDDDGVVTPSDAQERALMNVETAAAVNAVAKHHHVQMHYARQEFWPEARRIRETARQRAEEKGTTTLEEIPRVAEVTFKAIEADTERDAARAGRSALRYIQIEANLDKARDYLLRALKESDGVEFDNEERELMQDTSDKLKRLLALLDRAIAGAYDKSWQNELRVLEGGKAS